MTCRYNTADDRCGTSQELRSDYEILRPLGAGGMGEVYLAEDTILGRRVALKFLSQEITSDGRRVRRFEREARTISMLNHPNVATLLRSRSLLGRDATLGLNPKNSRRELRGRLGNLVNDPRYGEVGEIIFVVGPSLQPSRA